MLALSPSALFGRAWVAREFCLSVTRVSRAASGSCRRQSRSCSGRRARARRVVPVLPHRLPGTQTERHRLPYLPRCPLLSTKINHQVATPTSANEKSHTKPVLIGVLALVVATGLLFHFNTWEVGLARSRTSKPSRRTRPRCPCPRGTASPDRRRFVAQCKRRG